jgi:small GTP-binding protein
MEQNEDLNALMSLIQEGENYDIDTSEISKKLKEYISTRSEGIIKIVLLGSFSDGKTTAVAGLLGKLEENMKIDEDESSDELTVYHMEALGRQYQIVDTPGLFGTKEREVDGKTVRFSEITEKYISEAHIIIYVCNSVNTLKDSHKEIIKRVLRDYGKLQSTIFVINKMDDVADTNDEAEYQEMSAIKRGTFIDRLKQVIGLTPDEERKLNIACISANPKGKGLKEWFTKKDEYARRSHMRQLESCVSNVVKTSDVVALSESTDEAVVKDVGTILMYSVAERVYKLKKALKDIKSSTGDMKSDLDILKSELVQNKGLMTNRLLELKKHCSETIDSVDDLSSMGTFIEDEIGIEGESLDFNIIERQVNQILSECSEANNAKIKNEAISFERQFDAQNKFVEGAIKGGLKCVPKLMNGNLVLKVRNLFFKGLKFKPWGAIKLAKRIGTAAAALGVAIDGWNLYKKYKDSKKLDEIKKDLKDALNNCFKEVFSKFDDEASYYKNFAPSYIEMSKAIKERENQISDLEANIKSLDKYKEKFQKWYGSDIEDAIFEEV